MIGVAVHMRAGCKACGRPVPVNALVTHTTCYSCTHPLEIPVSRWDSLLESVVAPEMELGKTGKVSMLGEVMELASERKDPACPKCAMPIPDEAKQFAQRGFMMCGGCGTKLSVRRPPADLAPHLQGATLVIGEELAQLGVHPGEAPKAAQPVTISCANCRAPLAVDGSQRLVRCTYCSTDQYLPDDLWLRLHPVKQVAPFFLCWESLAARQEQKRRDFKWSTLDAIALGSDGNLYCAGSIDDDSIDDDSFKVWCMTPDFTLRWVRNGLGYQRSESARVVFDPRGRLLVWQPRRRTVTVLSCVDGTTLGTLGEKEPDGAKVHHLDLDEGNTVAVDHDGTILAQIERHLVRFDERGHGIPTWPPRPGLFGQKAEKLRSLYFYDEGERRIRYGDWVPVSELRDYPKQLDGSTSLSIGWDGALYLAKDSWIAKLDRSGKILYKTQLPADVAEGSLGGDASGNAWLVCGYPERTLVKVTPHGQVVSVAVDHVRGGVLPVDSTQLAVAPDGTTFHVAHSRQARVIAPDGSLVRITDKARDEDAYQARRAREKANEVD